MNRLREIRQTGILYPVGQWLQDKGTNKKWIITGVGIDIHGDNAFYFHLHCPSLGTSHWTAFREDVSLEVIRNHYVKVLRGD